MKKKQRQNNSITVEQQEKTPVYRNTRSLVRMENEGYMKREQPTQLSLFADIDQRTMEQILAKAKVEKITDWKEAYLGIDMDGDGYWLVETLQKLLYEHSKTASEDEEFFYKGDELGKPIKLYDGKNSKQAVIITSLYEIAKAYLCTDKQPGSKGIAIVKDVLKKYSNKCYLLKYNHYQEETVMDSRGNEAKTERITVVQGYRPLFTYDEIKRIEKKPKKDRKGNFITDADGNYVYDEKERMVARVELNPIFTDNIQKHYNTKPVDYLDRIKTAYGKGRPGSLIPFLNKLIEVQNLPGHTLHIRKETILDIVGANLIKKRHKNELKERFEKYKQVAKDIGLLVKYWENIGQDGSIVSNFEVVDASGWK